MVPDFMWLFVSCVLLGIGLSCFLIPKTKHRTHHLSDGHDVTAGARRLIALQEKSKAGPPLSEEEMSQLRQLQQKFDETNALDGTESERMKSLKARLTPSEAQELDDLLNDTQH